MTKRFVAILLVVLLCVGLLPSSVLAGQGGKKAGGGNTFPMEELQEFTVTWTDENENPVYSQKNGQGSDQSTIDALPAGFYTVTIAITDGEGAFALEMGQSYTLQLDWPKEEVLVEAEPFDDEILFDDKGSGKQIHVGRFSVDQKGLLTISINQNDDINHLDYWKGEVTFSVRVKGSSDGYDVPWEREDYELTKSTDGFNAATQRVAWNMTTKIPAYSGSGEASEWSVQDSLTGETEKYGHIENKMEDIMITASSENGYNGPVPFVEEAGDEHPFAYYLVHGDENPGSDTMNIILVNRCACDAEHCPGGNGGCPRRYYKADGELYVDGNGEAWCSCWQYRYNERLTITYSVDPSEVLQQIIDIHVAQSLEFTNYAHLCENDTLRIDGSAKVILQEVLTKSQKEKPTPENDYVATFQVVVNPGGDSFAGADSLTVTDTMEHLVYLRKEPNMTIETEKGSLKRITEEEWQAMPEEEKTEDTYFSLDAQGEELTILIYKPTNLTYTITYDAALNETAPGESIEYRNTASIGHIEVSVTDTRHLSAGEWMGASRLLEAAKVDAYHHDMALPGAVFNIYQYVKDGDDLFLTQEVTDERGVLEFGTDRLAGIIVFPDTLYYLQEAEAPEGYILDETKYYFYHRTQGSEGISQEDLPEGVSEEAGNLFIAMLTEDGRGALFCTLVNTPIEEEEEPENPEEETFSDEVPTEELQEDTLEEEPEEEEVYAPPVKTGDTSPITGLILLCTAGISGIAGCVIIRRKK